jgi:hypothetical protein
VNPLTLGQRSTAYILSEPGKARVRDVLASLTPIAEAIMRFVIAFLVVFGVLSNAAIAQAIACPAGTHPCGSNCCRN